MGCGYQGGKRMFADFVDALIGSLLSMSGMDIAKMLVMWAHRRHSDLAGHQKGYGADACCFRWASAPFW